MLVACHVMACNMARRQDGKASHARPMMMLAGCIFLWQMSSTLERRRSNKCIIFGRASATAVNPREPRAASPLTTCGLADISLLVISLACSVVPTPLLRQPCDACTPRQPITWHVSLMPPLCPTSWRLQIMLPHIQARSICFTLFFLLLLLPQINAAITITRVN
jgi:hypothetical protein